MLVPFKVSARTARLIGRENIATSKGAIIELVKNGYDADSPLSIVYFDNYFAELHSVLTEDEYGELLNYGIAEDLLKNAYSHNIDAFELNEACDENLLKRLKRELTKLSVLYIIDTGEGMTQEVIANNWMTIGTDNKAKQYRSHKGRIKTGAKGIGRFALDKLGASCEMVTLYDSSYKEDKDDKGKPTDNTGYKWTVSWDSFEGDSKTIDDVNAELEGLSESSLLPYLNLHHLPQRLSQLISSADLSHGTILKIYKLRDTWTDYYVNEVYSDMEVLVPPHEANEFIIHLYSSLKPDSYGEITSYICDDYDYKLIAHADENQKVQVTIYRNESDVNLMPKDLFSRPFFQKTPYTEKDFRVGLWSQTISFEQLLPGFARADVDDVFKNIGPFDFTFYYLKRTYNSVDAKRFFYRQINAAERKDWLNKFGGIKLFRDNFRVRPYGERNDSAFDWLGLGARKVKNPAGIAKAGGGYRVEAENVAGSIKISRLTNVDFEDKSSREGLQENKTFRIFRQLICEIIGLFEKDRSNIAYEMNLYDNEKYGHIRDKEKAEELAKKILEEQRKKAEEAKTNQQPGQPQEANTSDSQLAIMAELNQQKNEEIEQLKEEQKVLRALASSGIVMASFSHDLSKINIFLGGRYDKLVNLLSPRLPMETYEGVEDRKNPYAVIKRMQKDDLKLQNWLDYSLSIIKKDKRKRKDLDFKVYFNKLKEDWAENLTIRAINLDVTRVEHVNMRAFEIDMDSIFHNLLVNSIEAFVLLRENRPREIKVSLTTDGNTIKMDYLDSGPGLSSDILNPDDIFKPLFTTKRSAESGEEIGTGLGMWLVKSIVEDYQGKAVLLNPPVGFGIRITFPVKYKRN